MYMVYNINQIQKFFRENQIQKLFNKFKILFFVYNSDWVIFIKINKQYCYHNFLKKKKR